MWEGPLEADKHSVFNVQCFERGNCVAKVIYDNYGEEVHKALQPKFAPLLYGYSSRPGTDVRVFVVEKLLPGGWFTLSNLTVPHILDNFKPICQVLNEITTALKVQGLVHGNLHADNLMIKMADIFHIARPVEIKAVNFERAGTFGTARYPLHYPGKSGDIIGQDDDQTAVDEWIEKTEQKIDAVTGGQMQQ